MWFDAGGLAVFAWLFMLTFWLAVILLVVWLVRTLSGSTTRRSTRTSDALAILERRYASGEIDSEEFESRRRLLRGE